MAEAYVPDPNSPEAIGAWQRSVEQRIAQLKLGVPATTTLGYANITAGQAGIAAGTTDLTGLTKTIVAGNQRLIKLTTFVVVQKHVTKSALQLFITDSANNIINQDTVSVDGTTDDYNTLIVIAIDKPVQGSKTYKVRLFVNNGTCDVVAGTNNQCYLLVEDIGLAPA